MVYLVDTDFLIRCWRDARSPERLQDLAPFLDSEICLVWVVKAEFLRGAIIAGQDYERVSEFLNRHKTVWPDDTTLVLYAQIYTYLRRANALIGPHDLWIAAAARQHQLPLLTRNVVEFQRVPDLEIVSY
jgi:tRNA(fMet)-specific endonuclease VapC